MGMESPSTSVVGLTALTVDLTGGLNLNPITSVLPLSSAQEQWQPDRLLLNSVVMHRDPVIGISKKICMVKSGDFPKLILKLNYFLQ